MSLSNGQKITRALWRKAKRNYETAESGDHNRRRKELTAATSEVLKADIEARKSRQQKRAA